MRLWRGIYLTLIMCLILAGCGSATTTPTVSSTPTTTPEPIPEPTPTIDLSAYPTLACSQKLDAARKQDPEKQMTFGDWQELEECKRLIDDLNRQRAYYGNQQEQQQRQPYYPQPEQRSSRPCDSRFEVYRLACETDPSRR